MLKSKGIQYLMTSLRDRITSTCYIQYHGKQALLCSISINYLYCALLWNRNNIYV